MRRPKSVGRGIPGNLIIACILLTLSAPFSKVFASDSSAVSISNVGQNGKGTLKGVVRDQSGEPLIGATVMIKGTPQGTVTDVDGKFTLKVERGQTLVVSFIGMETKEIAVPSDISKGISIRLDANAEMLGEVMVTGYQTLSRERSTGAFSKVTPEQLKLKRMDNLGSMLEGQIAGYVDGKIRGITTMNAVANPMVVIDGFPVENTALDKIGQTSESMPDLNPEDIESITVLKDAAAASIYGARAANGVIVITTKRAKAGDAQVSVSSTLAFQPYSFYKGNLTDAADIIAMEREWTERTLTSPEEALKQAEELRETGAIPSKGINTLLDMYAGVISREEGERILSDLASRGYRYYDQMEQYGKRNPVYSQQNLRVGKASERNSFNLSITYWNNLYEDIHSSDQMLGINLTNTLKLTDWLEMDAGAYLKYGSSKGQGYSLLNPGYSFLPYDNLVEPDGSHTMAPSQIPKSRRDLIAQYGLYDEHLVPMDELGMSLSDEKNRETRVNGKVKIDFMPGLNYDLMFQYETSNSDMNMLRERESNYMRTRINDFTGSPADGILEYNLPNGHSFYTQKNRREAYNLRHQLNFSRRFNELHDLAWIAGQEVRHSVINFNENTLFGYEPELLSWQTYDAKSLSYFSGGVLGAAQLSPSSIEGARELLNRFVSLYSNASYTYDDRYVLSGSIRWDRSNLWGTNSKYQNKPLWSVGGSWNISKEDFFHSSVFDLLKLRASYGIGGNIGRNTAPYLIASYYPSTLVDGMTGGVMSPPNRDIRWEKTATTNFGLDFSLFRHRLSGTLELYNKYSSDLLAAINGSPTQGFGYALLTTNNGEMVNRGIELSLHGEVLRQKEFAWNASLLFSINHNEVKHVSIKPGNWNSRITLPYSYPQVGYPLQGIYAYRWAGLNAEGDPQVYDADSKVTSDPVRDSDALVYSGTTVPVYSASLTNVLSYGDFELSFLCLLDAGHKLRASHIPQINMASGRISSTARSIMNRFTSPSAPTDVPRLLFSNDSENYNTHRSELYNYADIHIYDASHIRLRNVSLAYRLPKEWCRKVYLSGARLQFNVEDAGILAFDKRAKFDLGGMKKPTYVWGFSLNF